MDFNVHSKAPDWWDGKYTVAGWLFVALLLIISMVLLRVEMLFIGAWAYLVHLPIGFAIGWFGWDLWLGIRKRWKDGPA